ncbi:MAG: glycosyltransferase [Planctomycetes bacterium]|nr:glycosyltransferase [Planctomycetota bacterium]
MAARPAPDHAGGGFRDLLLLGGGAALSAALGFVSLRILLTHLDQADYGRQSVFLAWGGFATVLLTWPVWSSLRLGAEEYDAEGRLEKTLGSLALLVGASAVVVAPAIWLCSGLLEASVGIPSAGLLLGFAGLAALAQLATALLRPRGLGGWITLVSGTTRLVFCVLLVLAADSLDLGRALFAAAISPLPVALFVLWVLRDVTARPRPDRVVMRRASAYGAPLLARFLGVTGLLYVDVLILRGMLGEAAAGSYDVAYRIAEQAVVFGVVLEVLPGPLLASAAARGRDLTRERYLRLGAPQVALMWGVAAALLVAVAEPVLVVLGAHTPEASAAVLQALAVAVAVRGAGLVERPVLQAQLLSRWPTVFCLLGLALNVILDVVLIHQGWGVLGPALGTLAGFSLEAVLRTAYLRRCFAGATWRVHLGAGVALGFYLAALAGLSSVALLGLWALTGVALLGLGRAAGLFPAETAELLDHVRLPGTVRRGLRRFYAAPARDPVPAPDLERTRLLLAITCLHPAGAERVVFEVATRLDPSRWQVLVVSLQSPDGDDGDVDRALRARGIPVVALRMAHKLDLLAAARLRGVARTFRPHLAHGHLFHASTAVRLLVPRPARRLSTLHVVERRRLPLRFALARRTAGRDDATTAVSTAVADFARARLGVRAPRVIYNGVELARFADAPGRAEARAVLELAPEATWIGAVGRLDPQKGFDVLLRALPEVPGAKLLIAGEGPERRRLEELVGQLGLRDRVRLLGHRSDVATVLAACDLFCMPSRWEGFGLALAEAMAVGLPCVASRIDSLPEVLGGAGVLVPVEDPAALGAALAALLADPARAAELGERAREQAQRFSVEAMVAGYEALYRELAPA